MYLEDSLKAIRKVNVRGTTRGIHDFGTDLQVGMKIKSAHLCSLIYYDQSMLPQSTEPP